MTSLLPQINSAEYEVSSDMWTQLGNEITRVRGLIASGADLKPEDVQSVRNLAKQVREYGVSYRKAITGTANNYKTQLDQQLNALGYNEIEAYISMRRSQQQKEVSDRLNAKLTKFNEIVQESLASTQALKTSSIANFVANNLSHRFGAKLNSGAASQEIKNWAQVESVVHLTISKADEVLVQNPVMASLPANANSMRTVSRYLETGDVNQITAVGEQLRNDQPLLQRMVLQKRVGTDDEAIDMIQSVLNSDVSSDVKLERIKLVLDVHNAMSL